jgi:hypothetical protein
LLHKLLTIVFVMSAAIQLTECYDEPSGEKLPPHARAENSNSYGGKVDETILKRLDKVESAVSETREQLIGIAATIPNLATKTGVEEARVEIAELRTEVRTIAATIPHLATKADLKTEFGAARAETKAVEVSLGSEIRRVEVSLGSEIRRVEVSLASKIEAVEVSLVKWIIGIIISSAGLAFTIGKFVH